MFGVYLDTIGKAMLYKDIHYYEAKKDIYI